MGIITKCLNKMNVIRVTILVLISAVLLTSCSKKTDSKAVKEDEKKITIVTSFYVVADFAAKIGGDKVTVRNLLPAGSDPHGWEPSPKDIINIEKADIFIFNGANMEGWVEKVLDSIENKKLVVVEASKNIDLLEAKEENDHKDEDNHSHDHIYDPHVWLDPLMAKIQMESIKQALVDLDSDNAGYYEKNFEKYCGELDKLDNEYNEAVSTFIKKDVVVSHEAFGYLCTTYGLNQVGISGLDAEAEPTASRMVEVANFVKEKNVNVIFFDKMVNQKIADTIANSTGAKVDVLNPIASLNEKEIEEGKDYFTIMRENLETLRKALAQ